jgi:hypothetical protein
MSEAAKPKHTFYDLGSPKTKLVAAIIAFTLASLAYAGWAPHFGVRALDYALLDVRAVSLIPIFLLVLFVHELIHAAVQGVLFDPSKGRLVWYRGMLAVEAYGMGLRGQYIVSLVAPVLVISVVAPALGMALAPELGWVFVAAATLNAFFSARDLHIAYAVLAKTPQGALVGGMGDHLCWQE